MPLQNKQSDFADLLLSDIALDDINIINKYRMLKKLTDTLQATYPLVTKSVGKDFFRMLAADYIKQYPSRHSYLHHYGEYLSDFLAEYTPVRSLIYLPELAAFEWACHLVYIAADHQGLEQNGVMALPPASQLMFFYHPILSIVEACKRGELDNLELPRNEKTNLLIIRRGLDTCLVKLNTAEFAFLTAIQDGRPIAEATKEAIQLDSTFDVDEKLSTWTLNGTLVHD